MSRGGRVALVALVAAVACAILVTRVEDKHRVAAPPPPRVPVVATLATTGDVPIELEALGHVTSLKMVSIQSLVGGQVVANTFTDGQFVHQGDVLVRIDPRPLQATVNQDKATLDRDRANLANAEADLKRYTPLVKSGVVSIQQVTTQQSLVAQLGGTVAADEAALDRDQVQLGYTTITAPVTGVLGLTLVDPGNIVTPNNPATSVVLTQIQPVGVQFPLPQASFPAVQAKQAASGGLAVEAWSADGARLLDRGKVMAFNNQVDPTSGTFMLKANFPNAHQALWPGAAVDVRLVLDVQRDGVSVPTTAINQGPGGSYAWVVEANGTARAAPVTVRQRLRGTALVSSGLRGGERVVTDGQYGLEAGAHVSVEASATEGTPLHTNQPGLLGISQ